MNPMDLNAMRAETAYRTERLRADWTPSAPGAPSPLGALLGRLATRFRRRAEVAVAELAVVTEAAVAGVAELAEAVEAVPAEVSSGGTIAA